MDRSDIDLSNLDYTYKLLSDLHLTTSPENMGSVNGEDFMDVPDTPDRLAIESGNPLPASGRRFFHPRRSNCRSSINNADIKKLHAQHQRDLRIGDSVADNSEKDILISSGCVSDGFKKPELQFPRLHRTFTKRSLKTKRSEDRICPASGTEVSIETPPKRHLTLNKRDASFSKRPNMGGKSDPDSTQMFTLHSGRNKLPILVSDANSQGGNGEKIVHLISPDSPCYAGDGYARRKMQICNVSPNTGNNLCIEITPDALSCHDQAHNSNLASQDGFTGKTEMGSKIQVANDKYIGASVTRNLVDVNVEEKSTDNGKKVMACDNSQSERKETVSSYLQSATSTRPTLRRRMLVRNGLISPDNIVRTNTLDGHHEEFGNDKQDGSACRQNDKRKGKGIVEDNALANEKGVMACDDSQSTTKETVSSYLQSVNLARPTLRRRMLVRNGLISPDNIAQGNTLDGYHEEVRNDKQDGSACSRNDKRKGKGIVENNALTNELDLATKSSSSRFVEKVGGGTIVQNRPKRTFMSANEVNSSSKGNDGLYYLVDQCHDNRIDDRKYGSDELNPSTEIDLLEIDASPTHIGTHSNPVQTISSIISDLDPEKERRFCRDQKLTKRQQKFNLSDRYHPGDCSGSGFRESAVSYLHSSTSNVNLTRRVRRSQHCSMSEPFIEVDNLCSPVRRSVKPTEGKSSTQVSSDYSSARARQVEEDEILAHQLQEQLYDELPGAGNSEIDASIAWTLQQEENERRSTSVSIRNRVLSRPRDSSIAHLDRNYPLESFRNTVRSASRAGSASGGGRVPSSMRMAQLRRSFRSRSSTVSSAGRRFPFPSNMDLEMRIHLLEALEAEIGENNDTAMHHLFLQVERDFNENDYEMLLALDNDNDRHGGASLDQINRLPLSVVQETDHFDEACAICLETPCAGDSIRHLPCLHKFHKQCIDQWLGRQPLCPNCKSSIT